MCSVKEGLTRQLDRWQLAEQCLARVAGHPWLVFNGDCHVYEDFRSRSGRPSVRRERRLSAAHEINDPLSFVIANVELVDGLLAEHPAPWTNEGREMLGDMRTGAARVAQVASQLGARVRAKRAGR